MKLTKQIVKESHSLSDICRKMGWFINGTYIRKVKQFIDENNINTSHFDRGKLNRKWEIVEKKCPVCDKQFVTHKGHPREKITCSRSCSNTYFRTGIDHPNYTGDSRYEHRRVCFDNHEHKCIICGEKNIVSVHHFDENHKNNNPDNLIPLCPTHHAYYHTNELKKQVENEIIEYRNSWIKVKNS